MPLTATAARLDYQDEYAHAMRAAYDLDASRLATYLKGHLGRPTVAFLTDTADVNNVSRWASGKVVPEQARVRKMREAYIIHVVLARLFGSDESAADWFTGANQLLDGNMPAAIVNKGDVTRVHQVVKALYEVLH